MRISSIIALNDAARSPNSSLLRTGMEALKLPAATARVPETSDSIGPRSSRRLSHAVLASASRKSRIIARMMNPIVRFPSEVIDSVIPDASAVISSTGATRARLPPTDGIGV